jgi:hypothetical protein
MVANATGIYALVAKRARPREVELMAIGCMGACTVAAQCLQNPTRKT